MHLYRSPRQSNAKTESDKRTIAVIQAVVGAIVDIAIVGWPGGLQGAPAVDLVRGSVPVKTAVDGDAAAVDNHWGA